CSVVQFPFMTAPERKDRALNAHPAIMRSFRPVDVSTFRRLDFSPQIPAIPRNVARVPMSGNPLIEQSPNNDNRTFFRAATSVSSVCSVVQFPFVGGPGLH